MRGSPVIPLALEKIAHVELWSVLSGPRLNWRMPSEVRPFESGREIFTPCDSHLINALMTWAFLTAASGFTRHFPASKIAYGGFLGPDTANVLLGVNGTIISRNRGKNHVSCFIIASERRLS
jgi:hypothetical protein